MTPETADREAFQELLDSLTPQEFGLVAEADLGRQAREFFDSDIGRYLIGCAQQEHTAAMEALRKTSPWRRRRIAELQNQAWRAENFLGWLRELIVKGRAAEGALVERED